MRLIRFVDPMNMVVTSFRDVLYRGRAPAPLTSVGLVLVAAVVFVVVAAVFRRESVDLAKDV
jgi:ABC-type polysaccharide/polyol phosphate export permease